MKPCRKNVLSGVKDFVTSLGFDSKEASDVAFQKASCLAIVCGVKLEVCESLPELMFGSTPEEELLLEARAKRPSGPSPFPCKVYTPETFAEAPERSRRGEAHEVFGVSWCRPKKILWNKLVTRDIVNYNQRLHRQGHTDFMPSGYAVMLHELGHAMKLPKLPQSVSPFGAPLQSHLDVHGLNPEDVASRFGRHASRALFGLTSTEARYMQRWDLEVGQYMAPKGARMNPEPKPLSSQITKALELHHEMFAS